MSILCILNLYIYMYIAVVATAVVVRMLFFFLFKADAWGPRGFVYPCRGFHVGVFPKYSVQASFAYPRGSYV